MGKLFETYKRRETIGLTKVDAPASGMETVMLPPVVIAPRAPEPVAPPPVESEMPFIEVPEPTSATSSHTSLHLPRPETAAAAPIIPIRAETTTEVLVAEEPIMAGPRVAFRRSKRPVMALPHGLASELVVWREPDGPVASQFRDVAAMLRSHLQASNFRTLLLLPLAASGDAVAAVNLALALAQDAGAPMLLIDADHPFGHIAAQLGLAAAPGWREVLLGLPASHALQDTGWERLHILAAGNPLATADSPKTLARASDVLVQLRRRYELLVIKSAAWPLTSSAAILARICDASCLLATHEPTEPELEKRCVEALHRERARVLGSIAVTMAA